MISMRDVALNLVNLFLRIVNLPLALKLHAGRAFGPECARRGVFNGQEDSTIRG